eukprot:scaffold66507_cov34-Phaeocystis_antarctica.AAC.1
MSDALSWGDADAACLAANMQLASVHSAAQNAIAAAAMTMLDRSGDTKATRKALPLAWRRGAALVSRGLMRSRFWLMSP